MARLMEGYATSKQHGGGLVIRQQRFQTNLETKLAKFKVLFNIHCCLDRRCCFIEQLRA